MLEGWKKKGKAILSLGGVWAAAGSAFGAVVSVFTGLYTNQSPASFPFWILDGALDWAFAGFVLGVGFGVAVAGASRWTRGRLTKGVTSVGAIAGTGAILGFVVATSGWSSLVDALQRPNGQILLLLFAVLGVLLAVGTKLTYGEEVEEQGVGQLNSPDPLSGLEVSMMERREKERVGSDGELLYVEAGPSRERFCQLSAA